MTDYLVFPTLEAAKDANAVISYLAGYTGDTTVEWLPPQLRYTDGKYVVRLPDDVSLLVYQREDASHGDIAEIVGAYTSEKLDPAWFKDPKAVNDTTPAIDKGG